MDKLTGTGQTLGNFKASGIKEIILEVDEDTEQSIKNGENVDESADAEVKQNKDGGEKTFGNKVMAIEVDEMAIEEDVEDPETITELSYREYKIETMKDQSDCFEIRGLASARTPGNIFVCDQGNKCIKYIDEEFDVIYRYQVIHEPWDIAVVDGVHIVVTFPFVRMTQYFKIKNNSRIIPWFPVKAQNEYYGVCADRDNIIVTCKYNGETNSRVPSVHVLDRKGNVEHVIEKNGQGEHLFIDPNYIAFNSSTQVIFVSDQGSKQVISLGITGLIFTRFSAVNFDPVGLSVDESNGNIFVSNKMSVIQLNRYLKRVKTIKCRERSMENLIALTQCTKMDRLIANIDGSPCLIIFTI